MQTINIRNELFTSDSSSSSLDGFLKNYKFSTTIVILVAKNMCSEICNYPSFASQKHDATSRFIYWPYILLINIHIIN